MAVKMWSPKGDCQIALTSGHTFVIPGDKAGVELTGKFASQFQKEALSRGCLPVGMDPQPEAENDGFDRVAVISQKMHDMTQSDDDAYFTGDGKPKQDVLSKLCGFNVDRFERDKIWKIVEEEINGPQ